MVWVNRQKLGHLLFKTDGREELKLRWSLVTEDEKKIYAEDAKKINHPLPLTYEERRKQEISNMW